MDKEKLMYIYSDLVYNVLLALNNPSNTEIILKEVLEDELMNISRYGELEKEFIETFEYNLERGLHYNSKENKESLIDLLDETTTFKEATPYSRLIEIVEKTETND